MNEAKACQAQGSTAATLVNTAICDAAITSLMRIECGFTRGFAGLQLLGNATEVARSSKERARVALEALGVLIPPQRVVISLNPADLRTDGSHLDLPVAVSLALLIASQPARINAGHWLFAAELGLAGGLRPVKGVVGFAVAAMSQGLRGIVVASENAAELERFIALSPNARLQVIGMPDLRSVLAWLFGHEPQPVGLVAPPVSTPSGAPNFDDMILEPELALAAVTACAGMHSMLLSGVPGTGKSMLAAMVGQSTPIAPAPGFASRANLSSSATHSLPKWQDFSVPGAFVATVTRGNLRDVL